MILQVAHGVAGLPVHGRRAAVVHEDIAALRELPLMGGGLDGGYYLVHFLLLLLLGTSFRMKALRK